AAIDPTNGSVAFVGGGGNPPAPPGGFPIARGPQGLLWVADDASTVSTRFTLTDVGGTPIWETPVPLSFASPLAIPYPLGTPLTGVTGQIAAFDAAGNSYAALPVVLDPIGPTYGTHVLSFASDGKFRWGFDSAL